MKMNSALMSSLRFAIMCIAFAACAKANPPALGGETNWLKRCSDGESCKRGSCICGVCTTHCTTDKQCSGGFAGTCVGALEKVATSACESAPAPAAGLCLPDCVSDAECGRSFACREGVCVTDLAAMRVDATRGSPAPASTDAGMDPPAVAQTDSQPIAKPEPPAAQPGTMMTPAVVGPAQAAAPSACPDGIHPGSVEIRVRTDIDKLRDCKRVAGDVVIAGEELEDLSGLEGLHVIEGRLAVAPTAEIASNFTSSPSTISASTLKSLKGLDGLQSVDSLVLIGLEITTLEPLSALETAPLVWMHHMSGLRDLKGLEKLDWDKLSLVDSAELRSLAGLRVQASEHAALEVSECPKLSDLTALQGLVSVANNIKLFQLDIGDLTGLRELKRVGDVATSAGGLWISGCARLRDLNGLGKLESTAALVLAENENLETLAGMALTAPPNILGVTGSPRLTSLKPAIPAGAWNAQSINLERLPGLKSLSDLAMLQSVTSLMIQQCDGLTDLTGLEQLKTAGQVFIVSCAGLTSITGLDNLATVMGIVALSRNPVLTNARPLGNLKSFISIAVEGNPMLPQCEVDWLAQRLKTTLQPDLNGPAGTCPP